MVGCTCEHILKLIQATGELTSRVLHAGSEYTKKQRLETRKINNS